MPAQYIKHKKIGGIPPIKDMKIAIVLSTEILESVWHYRRTTILKATYSALAIWRWLSLNSLLARYVLQAQIVGDFVNSRDGFNLFNNGLGGFAIADFARQPH